MNARSDEEENKLETECLLRSEMEKGTKLAESRVKKV
jgi:hypothetical protein